MLGIIFNPNSKKGTSIEHMKDILKILDERGIEYEYRESSYSGETIELAAELSKTCDRIVAAGGDGTLFQTLTGTPGANTMYGIFPLGSGNDAGKALGIKEMTDAQLVDAVIGDRYRARDRIIVNGKYIIGVFAGYGISSIITQAYSECEETSKSGSGYAAQLLRILNSFPAEEYTVIIDGAEKHVYADSVTVHNLPIAGSGIKMCTGAIDDDGYIDVLILNHRGKIRRWLNMLALSRGKLVSQPNAEKYLAKSVIIIPTGPRKASFDGELIELDRLAVSLAEGKAKMLY